MEPLGFSVQEIRIDQRRRQERPERHKGNNGVHDEKRRRHATYHNVTIHVVTLKRAPLVLMQGSRAEILILRSHYAALACLPASAHIITSNYLQLFYSLQPPNLLLGARGPLDSMFERPAEVRLRAIGEGTHVLLALGFSPLPPPSNPPNPIPPASAFPPRWPWNLALAADLSNIESGDPQAANNNFSN